jgi:hypothetical protein
MTIPQADRDFFRHNSVYFEQARMGFLHGMPQATLAHMEHLYRAHLDRNFILTAWCSACVVDMMVRLSRWWEGVQQEEVEAPSLATMAGLDFLSDPPEAISADLSAETVTTEVSIRPVDKRPKSRRGRPKKQA